MLKTESNGQLNKENAKDTSLAARREFMYDKAYRNCRPVPDLYCIHSESKLEEIHNVAPQATTFLQNPVKHNRKEKKRKESTQ